MKKVEGQTYLTIGEVAKKVGRTPMTIKNWYEWWEDQDEETRMQIPLPEPVTNLDRRGTRYFNEFDIPMLLVFKENVSYGKMADVSYKKWGERGKEIQKKKRGDKVEQQAGNE